jgi:large subunit ribosomal protein L10
MVAPWKSNQVEDVSSKISKSKVVGVVSISGMPSKQLQSIRRKLEGTACFQIMRGNLLKRALEKSGIKGMENYIEGPSGVILTELNPFKLEKLLYENKTKAPAKAGQKAPIDLIVQSGDSGLPAGPLIGDLQNAGIKAKIQGGKIMVMEETIVVKKGDPVPSHVAPVLARLGIEPIEIMLKISAVHEDGIIYPYDVLHIDEAETTATIQKAHQMAFNLAYNAKVLNKATAIFLVQEAVAKARNLMINAEILNKETVGIYLARADAQANAIKAAMPADWEEKVEAPKAPEEQPQVQEEQPTA